MERLTIPHYGGNGPYMKCSERMECDSNCGECCNLDKIVDRLAYYEDMEEQGRLVVLPCMVGDTLFDIYEAKANGGDEIRALKVTDIHVHLDKRSKAWIIVGGYYFAVADFGKTVFLTHEEAEQALEGGAVK